MPALTDPFDVDVVIIGAGFTGLTVATEFARAGVSFVVLEARDRVGGKTESRFDELGRLVDTGGQFVNDGMTEVLALAESTGATRVEAVRPGRARTLPLGVSGDPWRDAEALLATLGSEHLDDARSVTEWVDDLHVPAATRNAVRSAVNGATCHDSNQLPISYLAQLNERTPAHVHELQLWFAETMHWLAQQLAAPIADRTHLGRAVRAVHVHDESVDVVAVDQVWHAREVVAAVPQTAYASLGFTPPLPTDIAKAATAFEAGTVLKYILGYPTPFWLLDGRNGIGQFISPPGLYFADMSQPDRAMLVAFVGGTTALEWARHPEVQRREAILHHAAVSFGDEALSPVTVVESLWAPDEWGGGGYCNVLASHAPLAADILTTGLPLVTFASTELAQRFPGYVEGAIHAGRAAAAQVLRRLGRA